MSKATTDRSSETEQLVNVGEVLTASLASFPSADHAPITISREFDDRLRVTCNRAALEQIFIGLLRNAAESLPSGPAAARSIRVAAWRTVDRRVLIEISDSGSGIAPEHVRHVFEDLFTTKLDQAGSGMRLAESQRLLTLWGGTLYVRATSARGSSFRVELPTEEVDYSAT